MNETLTRLLTQIDLSETAQKAIVEHVDAIGELGDANRRQRGAAETACVESFFTALEAILSDWPDRKALPPGE